MFIPFKITDLTSYSEPDLVCMVLDSLECIMNADYVYFLVVSSSVIKCVEDFDVNSK